MDRPTSDETTPPLYLDARTAADLMTANPASIRDTTSVEEAAEFLADKGIGAAPVINAAGRPVGVLSKTDLVVHAREKERLAVIGPGLVEDFDERTALPAAAGNAGVEVRVERPGDWACVRDLMTPTVFAAGLHIPAEQVVEEMLALRVHRLFVVDRDGVLVGVISALDVLRRLKPMDQRANIAKSSPMCVHGGAPKSSS